MSDFNISALKASVIDLADKCRGLRLSKNELRDRRRAGEPDPFLEWNDGKQVRLWDLQMKRNTRKHCSRHHLLAYAFARGRRYRQAEVYCDKHHAPSVWSLAEILADNLNEPCSKEARDAVLKQLRETLKVWLAEPATAAQTTAATQASAP